MNPAALLGLLGVGLGLFFLTGTAKASTVPDPGPKPGPEPGPKPRPVVNCTEIAAKVQSDANVYKEMQDRGAAPGDLCNAWRNLTESIRTADDAMCEYPDVSDLQAPEGCGGGYVPPGTDCTAELAAFQAADQAARAAIDNWSMNTISSSVACAAVTARENAATALTQKGCEIPGDDFDDKSVCDINPACDAGATALAAWSSLVAEGRIDEACAGLAAAQAAYNAMVTAECDMRNWAAPVLDCSKPEPRPSGPCADTLTALQWRRDQPWPTAFEEKCLEIDRFNSLVLEYTRNCGNPEGWSEMPICSNRPDNPCDVLTTDLNKWGQYYSALVAEGRIDEACQAEPEYNKRLDAATKAGCDTGTWGRGNLGCGSTVSGLDSTDKWAAMVGFKAVPRWPGR
jgi:hypothetical protein